MVWSLVSIGYIFNFPLAIFEITLSQYLKSHSETLPYIPMYYGKFHNTSLSTIVDSSIDA